MTGHSQRKTRVAVVGSGASGFGVLSVLMERNADLDVTLFDIAEPPETLPAPVLGSSESIKEFYDSVYALLRSRYGRTFPPPKTQLGQEIARRRVGKRRRIFESRTLGGLTNFWGGTLLPFTETELQGWPVRADELGQYFDWISSTVGISASEDGLSGYFKNSYATNPPIKRTAMMSKLCDLIERNGRDSSGDYELIGGSNRLALDTRPESSSACVYCGECMAGCFQNSIFSSHEQIQRFIEQGLLHLVRGTVRYCDPETRRLTIQTVDGTEKTKQFDRIFLCAGCPATSEIVMRSFQLRDDLVMGDNAVYTFPVVFYGRGARLENSDEYLAQANLLFGCLNRSGNYRYAQAQVYPNFDYLWRFNAPAWLWKLGSSISRVSRARLFWVRLYVHGDYSQRYHLRLRSNGTLSCEIDESNVSSRVIRGLMESIRSTISREGFWIPPIRPVRQKTNSHYGGTLPYGGRQLNMPANNEISSGIFVCDSSCFVESPAVSPTFTIMANAARVADRVCQSLSIA